MTRKPQPIYATDTTRTGGGLVFGLRMDMESLVGSFSQRGYAFASDIGELDAPLVIAGGATQVENFTNRRFITQKFIPR